MRMTLISTLAVSLLAGAAAMAAHHEEDPRIAKALSAAPAAISAEATVMLLDGTVLREGTNGWTCFPNIGARPESDPVCGDAVWKELLTREGAIIDKAATGPGLSYMLASGTPHIMVVVAEAGGFEGLNPTPGAGKTWIMWPDKPGRHAMIPIGSATPEMAEAEEKEE